MQIDTLRYDAQSEVEHLFVENQLQPDVGSDQWERGNAVLHTGGAGPCIVLAAHNAITKEGLLGHFATAWEEATEEDPEQSFIGAVKELPHLGKPSELTVWLGGSALNHANEKDLIEWERSFTVTAVQEKLSKLGTPDSALAVDWSDPRHVVDVELDCLTGILVVHNYLQLSDDRHLLAQDIRAIAEPLMEGLMRPESED